MNNSSATDGAADDFEPNWAALPLPMLIVWGLTGNILVCVAISTDKRLQNVTNYFLLSLACADLLVCVLPMPLSIMVEFHNGRWFFRTRNISFPEAVFHNQSLPSHISSRQYLTSSVYFDEILIFDGSSENIKINTAHQPCNYDVDE